MNLAEFGSLPRVEWHLDNWKQWMRHPELRLECPPKSLGFISGGLYTHLEDWEHECDQMAAEAVDAMIEGLSPAEQCAIHHRYLMAIYRFNREPMYLVLARAKIKLGVSLKVWGIL